MKYSHVSIKLNAYDTFKFDIECSQEQDFDLVIDLVEKAKQKHMKFSAAERAKLSQEIEDFGSD